MICRGCLETLNQVDDKPRKVWLHHVGAWLAACLGLILVWGAFLLIGDILVSIPSSFHDGVLSK